MAIECEYKLWVGSTYEDIPTRPVLAYALRVTEAELNATLRVAIETLRQRRDEFLLDLAKGNLKKASAPRKGRRPCAAAEPLTRGQALRRPTVVPPQVTDAPDRTALRGPATRRLRGAGGDRVTLLVMLQVSAFGQIATVEAGKLVS